MNSNIFSKHNDIHQTFAPTIFHSPSKLKNILLRIIKVCNYGKKKKLMTKALITLRFLKLLALSNLKFQHMGTLGTKFLKQINNSKNNIINVESNKVLKVHSHLETIVLSPY
jgi:hypothetical protein